MQTELRLMIDLFEKKVDEIENEYREKHKDNFDVVKMKKYANKKLRKERETLIQMNISPVIQIVNETEKYKY